MKKVSYFFIVLSLSLFVFACGDKTNKEEGNNSDSTKVEVNNNAEEEVEFEMLYFDKSIVSKLSGIKGNFIYGYKWDLLVIL